MKVLILGGTSFLGRLCALEAVARGHEVTVLNRGTHSVPDGVTAVIGDRLAPDGYDGLRELSFDSVIDTWGDDAKVVTSAVDALRGRIGQYVYISSVMIYVIKGTPRPMKEDNKLHGPDTAFKYAHDKIRGELEAQRSGVPTLVVRPGIILGPHEDTPGRLPWWLRRMERGGPALAPGPADSGMQFIDGRDMANFIIDGAEKKTEGTYNLDGETPTIDFKGFLEQINEAAGGKARLYWLEPEKVAEAGIEPWEELPIWYPPPVKPAYDIDTSKARAAGLRTRPASETIADTWAWVKASDVQPPSDIGLDPEKELATLKKYFDDIN